MWRKRYSEEGLWLFDRASGQNVLLDEFVCHQYSETPAQVSIALTNSCNWKCAHCFVEKGANRIDKKDLMRWLRELDGNGTMGVGFGGGEPLLYDGFVKAEECQTPTIQCNDTVATIFCRSIDPSVATGTIPLMTFAAVGW